MYGLRIKLLRLIQSHVQNTYSMWYACVCCRLTLNRSGGQCLDEEGTKVRRWSWSSPSLTPTPLHPVFLSLNKTVGVRVLGREQVFVSFLARGQQAKFSVGTCCAQVKASPWSIVLCLSALAALQCMPSAKISFSLFLQTFVYRRCILV